MRTRIAPDRTAIASYVGPRAFGPNVRAALAGLGYEIVPAFSMGRFDDASWRPALRLVDERQYERIPSPQNDPDTPIVLLTGLRPLAIEDDRIAGRVPRPVELSSLYPILQRRLERTPRSAPRVPTQLSARGMRDDHRWVGHVVSLSVGGCFMKSQEILPIGARLSVQFALPHNGIVSTRAECVHATDDGVGLAFTDSPDATIQEIAGFVSTRLATL